MEHSGLGSSTVAVNLLCLRVSLMCTIQGMQGGVSFLLDCCSNVPKVFVTCYDDVLTVSVSPDSNRSVVFSATQHVVILWGHLSISIIKYNVPPGYS